MVLSRIVRETFWFSILGDQEQLCLRQGVGLDDLLRSFLSRCFQEDISHHLDNSKMSFLNREFIC